MSILTLNELANYNAGKLVCREFDLDDFEDEQDFDNAVNDWLKTVAHPHSTKNNFYDCDEYNVADVDGDLLEQFTSEYSVCSSYWGYCDVISSFITEEVVDAAFNLGLDPESIEAAYRGKFASDIDFAQEQAESTGFVQSTIWPHSHINWERAARELMHGYSEHDKYYFSDNC